MFMLKVKETLNISLNLNKNDASYCITFKYETILCGLTTTHKN